MNLRHHGAPPGEYEFELDFIEAPRMPLVDVSNLGVSPHPGIGQLPYLEP
jgi:hypothetical protein